MVARVTGKPAILDPQALDLATLRQRIANIRERFALLERAVNELGAIADGSQFARDIMVLKMQMGNLLQQLAALADQLAAQDTGDNQAPPGVSLADFAELVKRVQGLEEGVIP